MRRLFIKFTTVSILIPKDITCKFNNHHLHTETDTKSRNVMRTGIMSCNNLTFSAALSESRTNHYTVKPFKFLGNVLFSDFLTVHKRDYSFVVIVCSSLRKALANTLICILQIIFTYKTDMNLFCSLSPTFKEALPRSECRSLTRLDTHFFKDSRIKSLVLHINRNLIYRGKVLTLYDAVKIYIAERSDLFQYSVAKMLFRSKNKNIRLNTYALQFFNRMLCRLSFKLPGSL